MKGKNTVQVEFAPEVLGELERIAAYEERTVEQQVRLYVKQALDVHNRVRAKMQPDEVVVPAGATIREPMKLKNKG